MKIEIVKTKSEISPLNVLIDGKLKGYVNMYAGATEKEILPLLVIDELLEGCRIALDYMETKVHPECVLAQHLRKVINKAEGKEEDSHQSG